MKKILILSFLLSVGLSSRAQEVYHIIHVKGTITVASSGESIKPGDKIPSDAEIRFGTPQSMAAAMSSKSGRFMIKPVTNASGDTELTGFLKDIIAVASGKLSTRGGLANLLDLKSHFNGDYLVLGGRSEIPMNEAAFPMDENTFFYVRYEHEGETINKKLPHVDHALILDASEIFSIDGKPIEKNSAVMEMFYYHAEWKTSQLIGSIRAYFPGDDEILPSVTLLVHTLREIPMSEEDIEGEVEGFFLDMYGKVYRPNLHQWYGQHF